MKKQKKSQQFGLVALVTFAAALMLAVVGMSTTLGQIKTEVIAHTPEAILASAGLDEGKDVFLPVMYYDQKSDDCVNMYDAGSKATLESRQFEWSTCEYHKKSLEQGLVGYELSEKFLPVATGTGQLTSNKGLKSLDGWFEALEGKSTAYDGVLKLEYKEDGAEFAFYNDEFYPLDKTDYDKSDRVNKDGHNHLFTMSFAAPFTVLSSGEESFAIASDDDTWVYIGNQLALDMGGIHDATTARFAITEEGEVYTAVGDEEFAYSGIQLNAGDGSIVRIFHADRDSDNSLLDVRFHGMSLTITEAAELAKGDGVQIAYDPTDPSYIGPLGETSVVKPDGTKGFIVLVTVEGIMVLVFAILFAATIRSVVRRKLNERKAQK